ncbi:DUF3820 family protein [uncultured Desulfuromonas sp.]|uniref:DUF3820 family protein n=1 Tax=uncultured Desulfuromonas sp. TaxID=181013 RepID=UPI00374D0616
MGQNNRRDFRENHASKNSGEKFGLVDLPEPYVVWMAGEGFPAGRLGRQLAEVYEIKINGLEYLFNPFCDNTL